MKLNKNRVANLKLLVIENQIKTEESFIKAIKEAISKIERGQLLRKETTSIGEEWGLKDLKLLVECIDYKID